MARPAVNPPHDCPGGCGAQVPHSQLACKPCWYLLPAELRARINNGDRPTHLAAVQQALGWFKTNTAGGVQI